MKEPVDHIRRPALPWRNDPGLTECGYDASKVKTLSRADFFARLKVMGEQRTAILTCMTCIDTAKRWGTWADDPRQAMQREIAWERGEWYRARSDRGERLRDELFAIEALVERHRAEFDELVSEREQRRAWNERKAALKKPPPPPPERGL